jgi:hypothetical protein
MRPIKVKPKKRRITLLKNKKNRKEGNIQGKYKVPILRGSHKKIVIIK